jgi:hypothetical protein
MWSQGVSQRTAPAAQHEGPYGREDGAPKDSPASRFEWEGSKTRPMYRKSTGQFLLSQG